MQDANLNQLSTLLSSMHSKRLHLSRLINFWKAPAILTGCSLRYPFWTCPLVHPEKDPL
jgi:hypothetical protein